MKKLLAIGEALIDFIPNEIGKPLKEVSAFMPAVGGAPANVCGAYQKLGGSSAMITQLGEDPFGDKIVDEFATYQIDCSYVQRTNKANTSLAFVALKEDGNREFSFYRKPGADMLLDPSNIKKEWFKDAFALHFCSVSLGDFPMKQAHEKAIEYAINEKAIVSFDLNLRFALWDSEEALRKAVLEYIPKAHILKISDEELEFVTGKKTVEEAKDQLFCGNVELVVFTKGPEGASAYTKTTEVDSKGFRVNAVDTTGAGDAFIGSFLYQMANDGISQEGIAGLSSEQMKRYLDFSNAYCSRSVLKAGAIASYPTAEEMKEN
ncbi:carbohydrate kinase family protein [Anaeromicropila herbilytica]|uniref:Fructokinase n=1 Tax=Anaeromicropila herbilytica TaxID=2785025 RepID=A0A7R7EI63_9FIRM|nr:carbohydrate kinase [Anaeromicropila herbilytica]BCN29306.1 fructokinase [Anaeromicropila herbilytica]